MLKRDFIMVQIEELGKVLTQLFDIRHDSNDGKSASLIDTLYTSLKIDRHQALTMDLETLRIKLDQGDHAGLQRMELIAKTMLEESFHNSIEVRALLTKAKDILTYIQKSDQTFSLERVELIDFISNLLKD